MIKTDKAVYRTRTVTEYDWLMEQLEEAGCEWQGGGSPICGNEICDSAKSDSYICVENGTISFLDEELLNYYFKNPNGDCRKLIDVSDIMEDKEETEILDKLEDLKRIENEFKNLVEQEEETDAREKLDAINTQINKQIEDLRKQGKEPKAIEYTIKVCFE